MTPFISLSLEPGKNRQLDCHFFLFRSQARLFTLLSPTFLRQDLMLIYKVSTSCSISTVIILHPVRLSLTHGSEGGITYQSLSPDLALCLNV